MRILWFTWKDLSHPERGGAELVTAEITKRLVRDGHEVIILTAGGYKNYKKEGEQNGAKVFRGGNRFTVYWWAYKYYKKNLQGWADVVIDEVNTIPFFASLYIGDKSIKSLKSVKSIKSKDDFGHLTLRHPTNYLFFHQLCREIWFYQMPWFVGWVGYIAEAIYLRMLSSKIRLSTLWTLKTFDSPRAITVSKSTRQDLMKYGFKKERIEIISEGVHISPVENLDEVKKYKKPTMLSLGAVRKMKRTKHQLKAFEIAKKQIPDLQFKIAGLVNDKYGEEFMKEIEKSPCKKDIEFMGRVSDEKKEELMQRSHLIAVTSLKEGWGLIVTEANSQGTPAVVYNVDGLRDSVKDGKTGYVTSRNTPENLAENIVKLLQSKEEYDKLRFNGWKWSKEITFEQSYEDFKKIIGM